MKEMKGDWQSHDILHLFYKNVAVQVEDEHS